MDFGARAAALVESAPRLSHRAFFLANKYRIDEPQTCYISLKKALLTCLSRAIVRDLPCSPLHHAKGPCLHARMAL